MRLSWIILACVAGVGAVVPGAASAKDEQTCEEQFPDGFEQALLDRRALGGDPAALATRAICSWPLDDDGTTLRKSASRKQIINAFFWTALAYCDEANSSVQELTDKLGRERHIARGSYRGRANKRLQQRFQSARESVSLLGESAQDDAERTYLQNLAALGLAGLVELGQTSACAIKVNRATLAGIWLAAADKWDDLNRAPASNPFRTKANAFTRALTEAERTQAQFIKQSLLIQTREPDDLSRLAAIAHMDQLRLRDVQWMLYVLNLYRGAMDGKYGTNITKAVMEAERQYLKERPNKVDGWLTNNEARDLFCKAALNSGATRPLALSYLGYMYAMGIGFPQDLLKSRAILQVAVPALSDVLGAAKTPQDRAVLTAAQGTARALLDSVNTNIAQSRLMGQNIAPFSFEASFLCPTVHTEDDSAAQQSRPAPDLPAHGFADMSAQGLGVLSFANMSCSGSFDESGRCIGRWQLKP